MHVFSSLQEFQLSKTAKDANFIQSSVSKRINDIPLFVTQNVNPN